MEFDLTQAVLGGLVGTIAMTIVMYMGSWMMGLKMDMPMTLGTMFLRKGTAAWSVGLMMHLVMGAIFFIIYAALLGALGITSAVVAWTGIFGVIHGLMAGAAFGMMPALHPRMATPGATAPDTVPAPGFFGVKLGAMAPIAIIVVHVIYGLVAGAVYAG
ncbi:MAG: hypothetical protein HYY01_09400 [Chloroflexi bacterium]|nr:hypothetical protein [Chloroflexota bacterium]